MPSFSSYWLSRCTSFAPTKAREAVVTAPCGGTCSALSVTVST